MNTVVPIRSVSSAEADALEGRFGLRVAARLAVGAESLPHDVTERLRVARQQAVAAAAEHRKLARRMLAGTAAADVVAHARPGGSALGWGGGPSTPWWGWLASALPVLLLLVGLLGIDQWQQFEQIETAAEIDVALLGDDLPPSAFTDPGFAEFLLEPDSETAVQ